jgi:TRAP-type C4-dicarboxylate transport system substrate-binding protein
MQKLDPEDQKAISEAIAEIMKKTYETEKLLKKLQKSRSKKGI